MNNKKGFISISIVYSFFLVFLLIMLAMLADYINKRYLLDQDVQPKDPIKCYTGDTLGECLFKNEYNAYLNNPEYTYYDDSFSTVDTTENAIVDSVKSKIRVKDNFDTCPTGAEGMYQAQDDFGPSYYYRGNVANNYVSFAGYKWRIVRVNGDGSVRMVLDSGYTKTLNLSSLLTKYNNVSGFFTDNKIDEKYVGYMYNNEEFSGDNVYLDSLYKNAAKSDVMTKNERFYIDNIATEEDKTSPDAIYCADKNVLGKSTDDQEEIAAYVCDQSNLNTDDTSIFGRLNKKICDNSGIFSVNSYQRLKYFRGLVRMFDYPAIPSLECNIEKGSGIANDDCRNILNLSSYSKNGMYVYDVNNIANSCASIFGKCTTRTSNVLENLCIGGSWEFERDTQGIAVGTCDTTNTIPNFPHDWCRGKYERTGRLLDIGTCVTTTTTKGVIESLCQLKNQVWTQTDSVGSVKLGTCTITADYIGKDVCIGQWEASHIQPWYTTLKDYYSFDGASKATDNRSSVKGNGALDYSIGLLSADEVLMSGSKFLPKKYDDIYNCSSSIYSETYKQSPYWTGTVAYMDNKKVDPLGADNAFEDYLAVTDETEKKAIYYFGVTTNAEDSIVMHLYANDYEIYARPVINLKASCKYSSGNGKIDNPYEVGSCDDE